MSPGEPSAAIRERVIKARQIQEERFKDIKGIHCNAQMTERMILQIIQKMCSLCTSPKPSATATSTAATGLREEYNSKK